MKENDKRFGGRVGASANKAIRAKAAPRPLPAPSGGFESVEEFLARGGSVTTCPEAVVAGGSISYQRDGASGTPRVTK